jgi:uncharacterized membrane protein YraQ (UPF0718 family)
VLSIGSAAYAKASRAENLIARAFAGRQASIVIIAAVTGALSPFCSCGVIPVIAALLTAGVPLAPVMAFWLASPLIDPSSFVLTLGILGLHFAIAKTVPAIGVGLLGGFGVIALQTLGALSGTALKDRAGNRPPLSSNRRLTARCAIVKVQAVTIGRPPTSKCMTFNTGGFQWTSVSRNSSR